MLGEATSIATLVGIAAAVLTLSLQRRQARHQFEHTYVDRYWTIDDEALTSHDDRCVERLARYLRLCEDEFDAMRLGQISWRTWNVWHDAFDDRISDTDVREYLRSHREEFTWIRTCADAEPHIGTQCAAVLDIDPSAPHLGRRWRASMGRGMERVVSGLRSHGFTRQ